MKEKWRHHINCFLLLSFLSSSCLFAQPPSGAYYFEGEEVVFEFDPRDYARAMIDGTAQNLDFADLDIYEVVVSGNFKNWSRKKWKMKRVGEYTYQLRKKITELDDRFSWEFKFLVNNKYMVVPDKGRQDSKKVFNHSFLEEVYNLKMHTIQPDERGRTRFFLKGFPEAKKVILAGTFNSWDEHFLEMIRVEDGWELRANLPPGYYEYKFIVDGHWMRDPANPNKVLNEHHTFNSILEVTTTVTFRLKGFPGAEKVVLAGSFNNWKENKLPMRREDNDWIIHLDLKAGKHWYKFIVDGKWMVDPDNPLREQDRDGHLNSVLIVN